MSFQQYLNHLRSKPPHVHSRIAFGTAFAVTAVIFAFWASSFTVSGTHSKTTVASVVDKAGTPSESLLAGVGGFFSDLKDIIIKPKEITYGEVEVKGGKR
jgi:hypothetical protein